MTDDERTALHIAGQRWKYQGAKETHIRDTLGWTGVRHAQVVAALIHRPDVEAEQPTLVRRLRRLKEQRARARSA